MLTAFKRELKTLFRGMAPYVFGGALLLVIGIYTIIFCVKGTLSNFEYALEGASRLLILLTPCSALWMHKRLWGTGEGGKPVLNGVFLKADAFDIEDLAFFAELGTTVDHRILSVYFSALVTLGLPLLIALLYPVILCAFGTVSFAAIFGELAALFCLGAVLLAMALVLAATQSSQVKAVAYTLGFTLLGYFLVPLSTYCASPYAAMLFFTVLLVALAFFVFLVSHSSNLALLVGAVPEIILILCFTFLRTRFEHLAPMLISKLSVFERFLTFTGGLLDLRALIYMLSLAAFLLVVAPAGAKVREAQKEETASEEEDASEDEKQPLFGRFPVVLPAIAFGGILVLNLVLHLFTGTALMADTSGAELMSPPVSLQERAASTQEDVTIYWITQNGMEDASIRSILTYYEAMSPRIHLTRLNPDVTRDYITTYVIDSVYNNSVLFRSGELSRFTSYNDIYVMTPAYDTAVELDDQFSHALEYFGGSNQLHLYTITGHEEVELSSYFLSQLQKEDITVSTITLDQPVPEDAAALLLNAPSQDLTQEQGENLYAYLEQGGDMLFVSKVQESTANSDGTYTAAHQEVLESILYGYGAMLLPGIVFEDENNAYDGNTLYLFRTNYLAHESTQLLSQSRVAPVLSFAQGLLSLDNPQVTFSPLLVSSENSFSKVAGSQATTLEKESGDIDGPLTVAAAMEKGDSRVVWVTSLGFLMEDISDLSSGGNVQFLKGIMDYLLSGSLTREKLPYKLYNYGIVSVGDESGTSRMILLFCFVFPFLYLLVGASFLILRVYRKNQAAAAELEARQREEDEKRRLEEEEKKARREAFKKQREEATRAALEAQKAKKK
ncbi:MAG: Gldg family protein [Lachnospiraceae bacterium]|nr:Gldg family protein [Lachnospiraceae bacterium]